MEAFKKPIFFITGIIGGIILIVISEITGFSHINLMLFGGPSWAMWFYFVAFGISFGLSSRFLKIFNPYLVTLISMIIWCLIFNYILNGNLFKNPIPFGIDAY